MGDRFLEDSTNKSVTLSSEDWLLILHYILAVK